MNTYHLSGIIDVGMYNSLLSPEVALDTPNRCEAENERLWDRFDVSAYIAFVCERAVIELKKLLAQLPAELHAAYVEESARIVSPRYYNHLTDRLYFSITADSELNEDEMQRYLTGFFANDWDAEFGPDYQIHTYIQGNMTLEDFKKEGINVHPADMGKQ